MSWHSISLDAADASFAPPRTRSQAIGWATLSRVYVRHPHAIYLEEKTNIDNNYM